MVISFLVIWSICLSSSLVHFKNGPEYLKRCIAQVFIPLIRFRFDSLVSSCFLVLLRYSFWMFIIKGFRTIIFIFIVISTTFWPICHPAFFKCLSNLGTFTELRTTFFIESTGVACSDSVCHNRVQGLSFPVLLLACSEDWTCNLQMIVSLEA